MNGKKIIEETSIISKEDYKRCLSKLIVTLTDGEEQKLIDNCFKSFSKNTRQQMLNELSIKSAELFIKKEKIDNTISNNIDIMNKIEESFN